MEVWGKVAYSVFCPFWRSSITKFLQSGTKMLFLKLVERGAHNTMNICSNLGATKSQLSPSTPSQILSSPPCLPPSPSLKFFSPPSQRRRTIKYFSKIRWQELLSHFSHLPLLARFSAQICHIAVKVVHICHIAVQKVVYTLYLKIQVLISLQSLKVKV